MVPLARSPALEAASDGDLPSPARFAIALMVICPSAPMAAETQVSSPGSSPSWRACIQGVDGEILAIVSVS